MVTSLAVLAVLAAEPVRVGSPGFTGVGLAAGEAETFSEHVATKLSEQSGLKVITSKEIAALLGAERQKQLLGCSDGTECMAELAGALGTEVLLLGTLSKVGSGYVVTLKLVSTKEGAAFATLSERAATADDVLGVLERAANDFAAKLREKYGGASPSVLRDKWWVGGLVGGVTSLIGFTIYGFVFLAQQQLIAGEGNYMNLTYARAEVTVNQMYFQQQLGLGVLCAGAAILLASIIVRLVL